MNGDISPSSRRLEAWSRKAGLTKDQVRVVRRIAATCLLLLLMAVFGRSTSDVAYGPAQHWIWGAFHYYVGAKYFPELGYSGLYPCALQADAESYGRWADVDSVRDMRTYLIGPRSALPPCARQNFTPGRWAAFTRDVEYFAAIAPPDYFWRVFEDKGFNPPPSWVALAHPVAQAVPLSSRVLTFIIFNVDVIAIAAGMLLIWRAVSGLDAILLGWLAVIYSGSFGLIAGNFLQYLWLPLVVLAVVLWTRSKPLLSGAALGTAAGLQMFPIFFALPILARAFIELLRGRRRNEGSAPLKFSCGLVSVLVACLLLGSVVGRGVGAWGEWNRKIAVHKHYLPGEVFNIGLANLTALTVSSNHESAQSYSEDLPNTLMRLDDLNSKIWIYYAGAALLLTAWLLVVASAPQCDLFGYGFVAMYIAVTLSPFYYLSAAMLPFMFWKSDRTLRLYTSIGTASLFVFHTVLFRGFSISFMYGPHLVSAWVTAAFMIGLLAISLYTQRAPAQSGALLRAQAKMQPFAAQESVIEESV